MASRYEVELTLSSAKDLKNINWRYGPLRPYAVTWVDSDRKITSRTDDEGDTCPKWNQTLIVPLNCSIKDAILCIDIVHHASVDKDIKPLIGSTKLELRDVVDDVGIGSRVTRTLKLKRPSGRLHGKLELEICVREPQYHTSNPYPPPHHVEYAPPSGYPNGQGLYGYQTLVFPLDGPIEEANLRIDIKHAEKICKPLIGSVEIPLRKVVDIGNGSRASHELELKRPSGRLQGKLEIDVAVRQLRLHATAPQIDNQTISAPSLGGFPHVQLTYTQPINVHYYMNYMQNICVLQPQPSNAPPGYAGQQYLYGQYPQFGYEQQVSWAERQMMIGRTRTRKY
ncbi:uncharacterized protein LOC130806770 isoform X2 [Amaranthus tricolor]|uniref:uncharacterized protein LOC130806770 isoform X2 n=1 Tax=Amaranthus tricolor TaxID=29722 RepID=UPI00258AD956|nr:uncharacterized protein LOC130806770 isoform X2 [Amaranthus tricolor]